MKKRLGESLTKTPTIELFLYSLRNILTDFSFPKLGQNVEQNLLGKLEQYLLWGKKSFETWNMLDDEYSQSCWRPYDAAELEVLKICVLCNALVTDKRNEDLKQFDFLGQNTYLR